jgi:hypothetical protein
MCLKAGKKERIIPLQNSEILSPVTRHRIDPPDTVVHGREGDAVGYLLDLVFHAGGLHFLFLSSAVYVVTPASLQSAVALSACPPTHCLQQFLSPSLCRSATVLPCRFVTYDTTPPAAQPCIRFRMTRTVHTSDLHSAVKFPEPGAVIGATSSGIPGASALVRWILSNVQSERRRCCASHSIGSRA